MNQTETVERAVGSLLADLGVIGMEPIEPVVLAALVTGEPLLLIGPHGTAKSYLLNRIAVALGLQWRHYNASLLNFDDLVGYPSKRTSSKRWRPGSRPAAKSRSWPHE